MQKHNLKLYTVFISIIAVTVLIYFKGLFGDYVFDDAVNILENNKIKIESLSFESLKSAFYSGDAGPLGRPISMLSFAMNYYFNGFDPFYFKLTNLIIHLLNGILVFIFSRIIFSKILKDKSEKAIYMALATMLVWLIHPLNLTSILYIVQRMTSLSTFFGFLAITLYCLWRSDKKKYLNTFGYFFSIGVCLIASVLSKESGVLFILLIYWIELTIFRGQNENLKDIYLRKIKIVNLLWLGVVIGIFVLIYLFIPFTDPNNFLRRDFTLTERLLTESRVVFFYLKLFFIPSLSELSLYHDDFLISKTITSPITTMYSVVGLLWISLISILTYKKYPLFLFAWGWFLISQLLESTVVSLELIHEHRNYFSTIGFLILIIYSFRIVKNNKIKPFIYLLLVIYTFNLAFITWQRALIWSNLVDHAAFEANSHPLSDRANYQMARIYMKLMDSFPEKKQYYANLSEYYLKKSRESYIPANGAWFAELHLAAYLAKQPNQQYIDELVYRLKTKPFHNSNISFLSSFTNCQIQHYCNVPHDQAVHILAAGLDSKSITPDLKAELYKLLAQYYVEVANDFIKGQEFMNDALTLKDDVNGHLLLSQIYRLSGQNALAQKELYSAKELDKDHVWFKEIMIEQKNIQNAEAKGQRGI